MSNKGTSPRCIPCCWVGSPPPSATCSKFILLCRPRYPPSIDELIIYCFYFFFLYALPHSTCNICNANINVNSINIFLLCLIVFFSLVLSFSFFHTRKLGLDLVPRLGTLAVDPHKIGIVSLHQVHQASAENAKAASVSVMQKKNNFPMGIEPNSYRVLAERSAHWATNSSWKWNSNNSSAVIFSSSFHFISTNKKTS